MVDVEGKCHFITFVLYDTGMLVYFLYGIHNSKEGDSSNTYSMLMTSSEAGKGKWGSTTCTNFKGALTVRKSSTTEKRPIIDDEEGQ